VAKVMTLLVAQAKLLVASEVTTALARPVALEVASVCIPFPFPSVSTRSDPSF
jgi:hypothetical protein